MQEEVLLEKEVQQIKETGLTPIQAEAIVKAIRAVRLDTADILYDLGISPEDLEEIKRAARLIVPVEKMHNEVLGLGEKFGRLASAEKMNELHLEVMNRISNLDVKMAEVSGQFSVIRKLLYIVTGAAVTAAGSIVLVFIKYIFFP